MQTISVKPNEKGTAKVTIAPTDEDGTALVFGDLTTPQWQLMRTDGTVVNSRTFAASALSALSWALTGDDLAIFGDDDAGHRIISVQATYTTALGAGLLLKDECSFTIARLLGQTDS